MNQQQVKRYRTAKEQTDTVRWRLEGAHGVVRVSWKMDDGRVQTLRWPYTILPGDIAVVVLPDDVDPSFAVNGPNIYRDGSPRMIASRGRIPDTAAVMLERVSHVPFIFKLRFPARVLQD